MLHALLRITFCALVFLLLPESNARAQANSFEAANEIRWAIQRAEYQMAADLADSAIANFADFSPAQLAEIHALAALIASERGEPAAIDAHFLSALQLNASHQLDPIFFSPEMQNRFEQLRAKIPKMETPVRIEPRYIILPDPRIQAVWRSSLFPGWGQRYKGQKIKGGIFSIGAAALAGATITAHLLREHAEQNYLNATEENEIIARYDAFNRYHLLRNNLALALGAVWGAAVLDALIVRVAPKPGGVGLIPTFQPTSSTVSLSLIISLKINRRSNVLF
jgi:hypothetical protein